MIKKLILFSLLFLLCSQQSEMCLYIPDCEKEQSVLGTLARNSMNVSDCLGQYGKQDLKFSDVFDNWIYNSIILN